MSTTGARLSLAAATRLAEQLYTELVPVCARLEVAGSVRRGAPTVGDLELVAVPQLAAQYDLFGEASGVQTDLLAERLTWMLAHGECAPRLTSSGQQRLGPRYQALVYEGAAVDLFIVREPAQWGVILAIRTGPAAFSHRLVTPRREGGWLPDHLQVQGGALRSRTSGEVLPTPEERDFFAALGRPYLAPEVRR
jgi:DNA polymerase/3'-5' exonuclease PolX